MIMTITYHYHPLPWLWGNENYHDIDCGLAVLWKNMKACDGANGKWELIPENQPVPSWIRGQRPLWLLTNERWDSITEQWDQGSHGLAQGPNQLKTSNKSNVLKHAGKSPRISKEMFERSLHFFLWFWITTWHLLSGSVAQCPAQLRAEIKIQSVLMGDHGSIQSPFFDFCQIWPASVCFNLSWGYNRLMLMHYTDFVKGKNSKQCLDIVIWRMFKIRALYYNYILCNMISMHVH